MDSTTKASKGKTENEGKAEMPNLYCEERVPGWLDVHISGNMYSFNLDVYSRESAIEEARADYKEYLDENQLRKAER